MVTPPPPPPGLQLPKVVKAEFSVDRNGLSVNPSALFIKDTSEAPETIVQYVSVKSREGFDLKQIHLIRIHTLFQNPRELGWGVGSGLSLGNPKSQRLLPPPFRGLGPLFPWPKSRSSKAETKLRRGPGLGISA